MDWVAHMPSMGSAAPPQVPRPGLCQSARRGLEPPPASRACCRSHSVANIITCAGWPGPPRAGKNTPADSKNTSSGSQPRQGFSLLREVFPATSPQGGLCCKVLFASMSVGGFPFPRQHTPAPNCKFACSSLSSFSGPHHSSSREDRAASGPIF